MIPIAPIISAAASLGGAFLNSRSVTSNNQMQQNMIREQNAYNSPVQQVSRIRQAGLNPYMLLGQVNSGNQQAIASTQPQNFDSAVSGISNAASQFMQQAVNASQVDMNSAAADKTRSETALSNIDIETRKAKNLAEIQSLVNAGLLSKEQASQIETNLDLIKSDWNAHVQAQGITNRYYGSIADFNEENVLEKKLSNRVYKRFGEQQAEQDLLNARATYHEILSRIGLNNSSVGLNNSSIALNAANTSIANIESHNRTLQGKELQRLLRYNLKYHSSPTLDYISDKLLGPIVQILGHLAKMPH